MSEEIFDSPENVVRAILNTPLEMASRDILNHGKLE